jgi:hypothetical protein
MVLALVRKARQWLAGAAFLGLGIVGAQAEDLGIFHHRPPQYCPAPCPTVPEPAVRDPLTKEPLTKEPAKKDPNVPELPQVEPTLQPVTSAALGDSFVSLRNDAGYIDNALPFSHFRLRYDSATFSNRPDRAEFFYAKCGCFKVAGIDPNANGPPLPETTVDYQDLSAYLEVAGNSRFSVFVELPIRALNPDQNANTTGLADMNAGFKAALWTSQNSILTFQFRTYIPTGDSDRGLGTNHVSLEPSILFAHSMSEKLLLFGQIGDWIPIGGSDFAGNVLRYGVGASYLVMEGCNYRVVPVAEVLGWTVLDGKKADFPGNIIDASGDTIVNAKLGVRVGFGPMDNMSGLLGNSDLYVGYGRALTGDVWYKDILRVEYRMRF